MIRFWRRCRCSHLLIAPGVMTRIPEPDCPRHRMRALRVVDEA